MWLNRSRRLHISWHIAWVAIGVLSGTALSVLCGDFFANLAWLIVAITLLAVAFMNRTVLAVSLSFLAGTMVGLWRSGAMHVSLQGYAPHYNQTVTIQGNIAEDTTLGPGSSVRLQLQDVRINQQSLPGRVWVDTSAKADLKRGDSATFEGKLSAGFGSLSATMYRARLTAAERPQPGDIGREVRDWFASYIRLAIPEPEASLGIGFLVGQRSTLPQEFSEQMQLVGLTHIIVASGYNLTILVRLARQFFASISRYLATASAGLLIAGFIAITGMSPSMSRAGLIAGLSLAAWFYGRIIHPLVLLPFAAAITVLVNPFFLWGDVGWYLSFAAFAGLLLLAPLLTDFFSGKQQPGVFSRIFIETASAQIVTLPIIAWAFGQIAPLALPANLLVLPLIPATMLLTFMAGLGGVFIPALATLIGFPATALLNYMTGVVQWLAQLPWADYEITFGIPALIASYALLILLCLWLQRQTKHSFKRDTIIE